MGAVRLDSGGMAQLAKSAAIHALVAEAAEKVADDVRGQGIRVQGIPGDIDLPVRTSFYQTDRARASVTIAHPSGLAVQAKHGALTKAASANGLEVDGS